MENEGAIKADWGKLSKKFLKSIILDIIDEIASSKDELILKFAKDKKFAKQVVGSNNDSHNLATLMRTHTLNSQSHSNESDMEVDQSSDEEIKSSSESNVIIKLKDAYSWESIEKLFGGNFKNTMTKQIKQGKVLLQTHPNLWGYHSYFNMKNTIESLITDDHRDKVYYHLRNSIRSEFWRNYERTRSLLLRSCRLSNADRAALKNDGPLERYMLRFLLANDPDLIRILGTYDVRIECVPLFFGFGLFQGEKDDIRDAAAVFDEFHRSERPFVLTVILGVVNHWSILVAFKRSAASEPQLVYLDSRNIEALNIDELAVGAFVEQRDRDIRQLTGRPPTGAFYKKYLKHFLFDVRMLLHALEATLSERAFDLRELYTKRTIHNVLKSFARHFEAELEPRVAADDRSRAGAIKRAYLAVRDPALMEELSEFVPFVLDCDTDFAPLFMLKKGDSETYRLLLKLADWFTNHHEPYHIRRSIVGAIKTLNYKVTLEDWDLLLFWILAIEHMAKNCIDSKFRKRYPQEATQIEYIEYGIEEIKKVIQKCIQK